MLQECWLFRDAFYLVFVVHRNERANFIFLQIAISLSGSVNGHITPERRYAAYDGSAGCKKYGGKRGGEKIGEEFPFEKGAAVETGPS